MAKERNQAIFSNSLSSALSNISRLSGLASFPNWPSRRVWRFFSRLSNRRSSASPNSLNAPSRPLLRRQMPEANSSESKTLTRAFDRPRERPRALKENSPSFPLAFPMPRITRRLVDASILLLATRASLLLTFTIRLQQRLPLIPTGAAWPFAPDPVDYPDNDDRGEEAKDQGKEEVGYPGQGGEYQHTASFFAFCLSKK